MVFFSQFFKTATRSMISIGTSFPTVAVAALAFTTTAGAWVHWNTADQKISRKPSTLVPRFAWPLANYTSCESQGDNLSELWDELENSSKFRLIEIPDRAMVETHVIYGQLLREGVIDSYDVYKPTNIQRDKLVVVGRVQLGHSVDGHKGLVHGGILALLIDDILGFGFHVLGIPFAVTANLNVDYRQPVPSETSILLLARLEEQDGRKLRWEVKAVSSDLRTIYCEATSLYIIPRAVFEKMNQVE